MFIDTTTLLIVVIAACCAVSFTFVVSWLSNRANSVLVTFAGSSMLIAAAAVLYTHYQGSADLLVGYVAAIVLLAGMLANFTAARQFRTSIFSPRSAIMLSIALSVLLAAPYWWGFDAVSATAADFIFTVVLVAIAREFWQCRSEQKAMITSLSFIYVLMAASFAASAITATLATPLAAASPPSGWTQTLVLLVSLLGIGTIGTLIVALVQNRLTTEQRRASQTDSLTGMHNRRALFEVYENGGIPAQSSVIMLDLDNFKHTNDTFGHDAGDQVLVRFADICHSHIGEKDCAVRMGGEEFVIVLANGSPAKALQTAEAIRSEFAQSIVNIDQHEIKSTVSIGVHTNIGPSPVQIDDILKIADQALYRAKSEGRNLVRAGDWLEVA